MSAQIGKFSKYSKRTKGFFYFLLKPKYFFVDKYIAKEMMKLKFGSKNYPENFSHVIKPFIE